MTLFCSFPQAFSDVKYWLQWSDNCCCQFKNSTGFFCRSKMAHELHITIAQHMGAPGHGKGPWDGEGGVIKQHCATALRKGGKFRNAKVCLAHAHLTSPCLTLLIFQPCLLLQELQEYCATSDLANPGGSKVMTMNIHSFHYLQFETPQISKRVFHLITESDWNAAKAKLGRFLSCLGVKILTLF